MIVWVLSLCMTVLGVDVCSAVAVFDDKDSCIASPSPPRPDMHYECESFPVHRRNAL